MLPWDWLGVEQFMPQSTVEKNSAIRWQGVSLTGRSHVTRGRKLEGKEQRKREGRTDTHSQVSWKHRHPGVTECAGDRMCLY